MSNPQPYGIGSSRWPGLAKLMEEMGELQQALGKIMACDNPDGIYWDGTDLRDKVVEEAADVGAALTFFLEENMTPEGMALVRNRTLEKYGKFVYWHGVHRKEGEDHG